MITRTALRTRCATVRRFLLTFAVSALMLLATATFGTATSQAMSTATNTTPAAAATALLTLINQERSWYHLRPLTANWPLTTTAYWHNRRMATANVLSHQLPGELTFDKRITAAGYRWTTCGENVAYNADMSLNGILGIERVMLHEKPPADGHRKNILNTQFTNVGLSVYFDNVHHKVWLTEDFGRPQG